MILILTSPSSALKSGSRTYGTPWKCPSKEYGDSGGSLVATPEKTKWEASSGNWETSPSSQLKALVSEQHTRNLQPWHRSSTPSWTTKPSPRKICDPHTVTYIIDNFKSLTEYTSWRKAAPVKVCPLAMRLKITSSLGIWIPRERKANILF